MTQPERLTHMVLTTKLEHRLVWVMIDCGANRNYVLTYVVSTLRSRVKYKDKPYPLTMADGTPVDHDEGWIRQELFRVNLSIQSHEETISLDIVNIKYDIILGIAWLQEHNPIID